MKAVILARVSTEEQREAGNSLPAQIARIENYCDKKNFIVVETFSFDESAYKTKRDEFDRILEYLKNTNEKIAVCFDKVDRLSRNQFDKRVSLLYEKAVAGDIELHFISDGQVINDQMSAVEKFQFGMSLGLAKYYSDAISDNVKRAYEQKRRKGEWIGKAPIGYKNAVDLKGNKTIEIDVIVAHLLAKVFELYSTGNYSYESIIDELTKQGLKTQGGKRMTKSVIEKIIKNPFYCGIASSPTHGQYPHKYEQLITKELFDRCQEIRLKKRKFPNKEKSEKYVFKGLLRCQNCGCAITPEKKTKPSGKTYTYYSCTNAKKICKRVYVSETELLRPVEAILERFERIPVATQDKIVESLRKSSEAEVEFHKAQVLRIRQDQDMYTQRKDALLDLLLDKSITKEQYDKKLQEYSDKLQLLNIEYEEHTKADCDYQTTIATVFSLARRAKQIFYSSEINEQRAFIRYLLQNPTVNEKKLHFTVASPYNSLLELSDSPFVRERRDSNSRPLP